MEKQNVIESVHLPIVCFFIFSLAILIDVATKRHVDFFLTLKNVELITFNEFHNYGYLMGICSGIHQNLRLMLVVIAFLLILILSANLALFLPLIPSLYIGISIFLAGIGGNSVDKIIHGYVIDFISFKSFSTIYFNLADLFQLFGLVLISISIFINRSLIWYSNNIRKKFIINKSFQIKFILKILFLVSIIYFTFISFSYLYLKSLHRLPFASEILAYLIISFFIYLVFLSMSAFFAILLSHRIIGSIYAVTRHLESITQFSNRTQFKLRKNDEFKFLEDVVKTLQEEMAKMRNSYE